MLKKALFIISFSSLIGAHSAHAIHHLYPTVSIPQSVAFFVEYVRKCGKEYHKSMSVCAENWDPKPEIEIRKRKQRIRKRKLRRRFYRCEFTS